jgi:putative acetyltransferase
MEEEICQLRDYRPGDEKDVFRIVKDVLSEYGLAANPDETDADLRDIRQSYIAAGGAFRILESGGRIAGSYGLHATTPASCELRKMYLLPGLRGRGLGRKMMDDALLVAKAMGFKEMTLETNSRLKEAITLYKSYGFSQFTPDHLSDRCDSAMRKIL